MSRIMTGVIDHSLLSDYELINNKLLHTIVSVVRVVPI